MEKRKDGVKDKSKAASDYGDGQTYPGNLLEKH